MPPLPTTSLDKNNLLVTIVITLFILSLISERLANFIKLNLQSLIQRFQWLQHLFRDKRGNRRYNFRTPETDPTCEKLRERGIQNIAILCGIFIAGVTGGDLFFLLQSGSLLKYSTLDFAQFTSDKLLRWSVLGHLIGFVATGLFVSLGSKFWHDLLDIVLYTSNLKRKLADPRTFQGDTADEIAEFINLTPRQLAQRALTQHGDRLRQQPGVIDVTYGLRNVAGRVTEVLMVYALDPTDVDVSATLDTTLDSGRAVPVPVEVIRVSSKPKALFQIGNTMGLTSSNNIGTFGCLLEGNDGNGKPGVFALTCSHVMTNRTGQNLLGWLTNPGQRVSIDRNVEGKWWYALRSRQVDIALARLDAPSRYQRGSFGDLKKTPRSITDTDVDVLSIRMQGAASGQQTGYVVGILTGNKTIDYAGDDYDLRGLIVVARNKGKAGGTISKEGDSGALLLTEDEDTPVGLLVAGDDQYSYAMPFTTILEKLPSLSIRV